MTKHTEAKDWAYEEFGDAELPDARLCRRGVVIVWQAALRPAGRVTEVFTDGAARQGAYDFLENKRVEPAALSAAMCRASARRSSEFPYVFVAVDGSSLTLTERCGCKGFGALGTTKARARGVKVISGYTVSPQGVPLGVVGQKWWARARRKKPYDNHQRKLKDKETRHWLSVFEGSTTVLAGHGMGCKPWFVADREADNVDALGHLIGAGVLFTVRSSWNRCIESRQKLKLLDTLRESVPLHEFDLDVAGARKRTARRARMEVRAKEVCLILKDQRTSRKSRAKCTVVEAREVGTTPEGEKPLEWRLLTSYPVRCSEDADLVVYSYTQRWKVEEFHKTWKSGACNVERSQLRKFDRVVKWATIMAAVASRIERLKVLSRTEPSLPASEELSEYEIRAVLLLKRREKKRTETIPDTMPTLTQATTWIAELGGYTGKSSGGPPGTITIRRGLERVIPAAQALEMLDIAENGHDPDLR